MSSHLSARLSSLEGVPILVVEDDDVSRKLLVLVLGGIGVQVTAVESAERAFDALAATHPRLMLVDLLLPGMSGIELVKALKADESTSEIICVAVTALDGHRTNRDALDAGCAHYLLKPIDAETLVAVLTDLVRKAP